MEDSLKKIASASHPFKMEFRTNVRELVLFVCFYGYKGLSDTTRVEYRINTSLGSSLLTHYRPTMPFGNREIYLRGSFQCSIVTISKILTLKKSKI